MAQKQKNNKNLTISINADLIENLDAFCEHELRTKSSVIEIALRKYLKGEGFLKEEMSNGKNNSSI